MSDCIKYPTRNTTQIRESWDNPGYPPIKVETVLDTAGLATEAKQDALILEQQATTNAILALKDGEYLLRCDANDNDRLVAITADVTDPENPLFYYIYIDNGTDYVGDPNDLVFCSSISGTTTLAMPYVATIPLIGAGTSYTPPVDDYRTISVNVRAGQVEVSTDGGSTFPAIVSETDLAFTLGTAPDDLIDVSQLVIRSVGGDATIQVIGEQL